MRAVRLYTKQTLTPDIELELDDDARHYASSVLRLNKNSSLTLFNGDGFDYECNILTCSKTMLRVHIINRTPINSESNLTTFLYLGISKSAHMDYAIQKSVEAGISTIQPVLTERTVSKANNKSLANKQKHWQRIIQSACEQSGRATLPKLLNTCELNNIEALNSNEHGIVFEANAKQSLNSLTDIKTKIIKLFVGPEGGISEVELDFLKTNGFQAISCGPRILRTETAALTAVLAMQILFGDLSN